MSKCPYCSAETRPGDVFCMTCGNRLPTPSAPQAQPVIGDATLPAQDDWGMQAQDAAAPSSPQWSDADMRTVMNTSTDNPGFQSEANGAPTMQATMDKIEQPAHLILHSDSGEVLQEYTLDKLETSIGRAPNSDILLSKDKLTSRRHATINYENGEYVLIDQRSANGTFVNGEQLEEMTPRVLHDGDRVGVGEHELAFRSASSQSPDIEEMPTVSVPFNGSAPAEEVTYRTREDEMATMGADEPSYQGIDEHATHNSEQESEAEMAQSQAGDNVAAVQPVQEERFQGAFTPEAEPMNTYTSAPPTQVSQDATPAFSAPVAQSSWQSNVNGEGFPNQQAESEYGNNLEANMNDGKISFNQLTNIPQPSLPDVAPLMAALAALDGQVSSLHDQLNATQEGMRNQSNEVAKNANQLRDGVRRVSDRMDSTIADVARSREALAWTDLIQLMEDVMNNPRDIEYVTKLARKARELNKVFQIHQNVLNTLAECNSLLRSLIGEDR